MALVLATAQGVLIRSDLTPRGGRPTVHVPVVLCASTDVE